MSDYWSPDIARLQPYVPGEQPAVSDLIKLNTNESPYPPSPAVTDAIASAASDLRLYPDPRSMALRSALAEYHAVDVDQVFVGNGSDEVLAHTFRAFFQQSRPVLLPDISYSFYPVYAELFGVEIKRIPLDVNFAIDPADYVGNWGGVIFPNPNAPTGCLLPLASVEAIASQNRDCVVVVDEAYIDFGGQTAVALLDRFDNVLVVRTFSKSRALAGMRVGYAVGSPALIEGLVRVKDSFNSYPLDRLAEAAAVASVVDDAHFAQTCKRVIDNREQLVSALAALDFTCLPSSANFVFARHATQGAASLAAQLRERHIIVRYFDKPRISDYLRISIGDESECARLVAALGEILA